MLVAVFVVLILMAIGWWVYITYISHGPRASKRAWENLPDRKKARWR